MISVIVVYNDKRTLNEILIESLKNQTAKFELIIINNIKGKFKSAAKALNYGAKKAKGRYLMFVHSNVELDSNTWLENFEKTLDKIPNLGIAGVVGMNEKGKNFIERSRGYISDCGKIWGRPFEKPEVVQTLDELLLVIPKSVFEKLQFDEKTFDHWYCYGADYCLSLRQLGLKAYVIPAFVYYRSLRVNKEKLLEYQKKLYYKHRKNYKYIFITAGEISWLKLKLKTLLNFLRYFYKKIFPNWIEDLKKELSDCKSVLDLGCGYDSLIQYCNIPFSVGVEIFEPYLKETRKKRIHDQYIKADIREVEFKPKSFDAILCTEVLEHLTKKEGLELIKKMENWAKKKIIITTPNGYLWQDSYDNNPLQEHKSGWKVKELEKLKFKVYGINGWKKLRGYKGALKYKPEFFWKRISDLTQKITRWNPKYAFQLFVIKRLDKKKDE